MASREFDFNTPITEPITLTAEWSCSGIDPDNPTFRMVKAALKYDNPASLLPIGTVIPDTYDGNDNPMIIGTYQTMEIDGEQKRVCGLLRTYPEPLSQKFDSTRGMSSYASSEILAFLQSTYLDNCSQELKDAITQVNVQWWNGSSLVSVPGFWHLFSGIEMYMTVNPGEGQVWEYWKNVTGLSEPYDNVTMSRAVMSRTGVAQDIWLRTLSPYGSQYACTSGIYGRLEAFAYTDQNEAVYPFCFIVQD